MITHIATRVSLIVVALALAGCTNVAPQTSTPDADTVIKITNQGFQFTPNEIRLKKGEPVTIAYTSQGGLHDWVVDEFAASTSIIGSGQTGKVTFTPDKTGTFVFYCSVSNHRQLGMVGTLIVEE